MDNLSIKIKNYKCFKDEAGFDSICRVNIIIGRNNIGKSALLDIIEAVVTKNYDFDRKTWNDNKLPEAIFETKIPEIAINNTFHQSMSGGAINMNHRAYGMLFLGKNIKWSKSKSNRNLIQKLIDCDNEGITPLLSTQQGYLNTLLSQIPITLEKKVFRRLLAERDILPEISKQDTNKITSNGSGITNVIQNFINSTELPSRLVEHDMLSAINEIFVHDANFTDIVCQILPNDHWEIYLEEKDKGRIALSKSGSGLKTVLSVLSCIFLIPYIETKKLSDYVFGFEELENNLHPALLRRLNDYIYKSSIDNDFIYFLTTHSNVLIDQFSKQHDAQIIHVIQNGSGAKCITAKTYIDNNGILDDLDVRASDLLQANGIIWVEGPSDRIYLNKWIELWSNGELKEGSHYQIIFYGGRLLSHLSSEAPKDVNSSISILNTNRNSIILIDSDKRNQQTQINSTKLRIKEEFKSMNSMCWITKGKEIENYISSSVVDAFLDKENTTLVDKYGSFFEHLNNIENGIGTKYEVKKPLLAEKLISDMTKENMEGVLDIDNKMNKLCLVIKGWNA